MHLPREFLSPIERVLREFPDREKELKVLDHAIAAACHSPLYSDEGVPGGGGGDPTSEPERIFEAKERNPHYRWLEDHVVMVQEGLATLKDEERDVVDLFFWQGLPACEVAERMNMEARTVWRVRVRALYRLAPRFLPSIIRPEVTD